MHSTNVVHFNLIDTENCKQTLNEVKSNIAKVKSKKNYVTKIFVPVKSPTSRAGYSENSNQTLNEVKYDIV